MKRKNFIIALIILVGIWFAFWITRLFDKLERSVEDSLKFRTIIVENLIINIPGYYPKPVKSKNGNWESYTFREGREIFRISITKGDNLSLQQIVKKDFNLEKLPEYYSFSPLKLTFVQRVSYFFDGIYGIKHRNKQNKYLFAFAKDGKVYYFELFIPGTNRIYKKIFDNIILSVVKNQKPEVSNKLANDLNTVCKKTYFVLCQTKGQLFAGISAFSIALFILIFSLVNINTGKLPENRMQMPFLYTEERVDTVMSGFGKVSWFLTAIAISNEGFTLYYRKKEMAFIDREVLKQSEPKKSFWGVYFEYPADKVRFLNKPLSLRYNPKLFKIKIFPKDRERFLFTVKNL